MKKNNNEIIEAENYHKNSTYINWDKLTIDQKNDLIDNIILKRSYAKITSLNKKDLLDLQTANAIKTIKDNLSIEQKNKFLSCDLYKTVNIAWKLIEKCSIKGG